MSENNLLTPDLARAARALTQVSTKTIASTAGLPKDTVKSFERGVGFLSDEENAALRRSLEHYGAVFLPEEGALGHGVRQKFSSKKVAKLESWENEGGPAAEDDV
ncbi:MAG: hypothetical protein LBE25_00850 [Arthrobacter sp.]|jgi:DNA-binding XRE family transcriptional regulator|nr:hypothetical protein [Arthrobacter sp.]